MVLAWPGDHTGIIFMHSNITDSKLQKFHLHFFRTWLRNFCDFPPQPSLCKVTFTLAKNKQHRSIIAKVIGKSKICITYFETYFKSIDVDVFLETTDKERKLNNIGSTIVRMEEQGYCIEDILPLSMPWLVTQLLDFLILEIWNH